MKRLLTAMALLGTMAAHADNNPKDSVIQMATAEMGKTYNATSFRRTSVHDPSIVPVTDAQGNKSYYIFGSHLAVSHTSDLMNWTGKYDESNCNGMFGTVDATGKVTPLNTFANAYTDNQVKKVKALKEGKVTEVDFGPFDASTWTTLSTGKATVKGYQWAPDVIWNPHMNKWCMYMSLDGDAWRSVIVMLTSDKIEGPYVYQGPVAYSGFNWTGLGNTSWKSTDLPVVMPDITELPARYLSASWSNRNSVRWGDRWPNDIDPCVFFDEEGELWMSYGSWSGGIFILKLDKETGLRDYTVTYPTTLVSGTNHYTSDEYFGKKIGGGFYVSGEASYIEHIGDYYYLFITNGGLGAKEGYEMHYFRSKNPDGPYVDGSGSNAIYTSYQMNYGPNAGTTKGMKILGSYQWENMPSAELSQGHNSVLLDDDGRAYLVYHTRFNDGSEGHQVRVHQLFVNEKGWLVAAPFEYCGGSYTVDEVAETQLCNANEIAGTYQIVLHPYKVDYANMAYQKPATAVFKANGQITGDYYGTWKQKEGTSYVTLHIRPKGTTTFVDYYGVILPQKVSGSNMSSVCFSAIDASGVSIWGCNVDGNYAVDYTYSNGFKLPVNARQILTGDVDLYQNKMYWGTAISWKSSHTELLSDDGKLLVPYYADGDSTTIVDLTYTLQKDNYAYSYTRQVRVRTMKSLLRKTGDVNGDDVIDTQDVMAVYEYMQGNGSADASDADVNGDGTVDALDVMKIYELMQAN